MDQPLPPPLVRQWITGVALVLVAEDMAAVGTEPMLVSALVIADTASETLLGAIANRGDEQPPRNESRQSLTSRAENVLARLEPRVLLAPVHADLDVGHRTRNDAVHHGAIPSATTVARAIAAARGLLALFPKIGSAFGAIPPESGLAGALAVLLDRAGAVAIAGDLRMADERLLAGDASAARRAAAFGLGRALHATRPSLSRALGPPTTRGRDFGLELRRMGAGLPATDAGERAQRRLDDLEPWVIASALGVRPAQLVWLREVVGWASTGDGGSTWKHRAPDDLATMADLHRALELVAMTILRLWEIGSLAIVSPVRDG